MRGNSNTLETVTSTQPNAVPQPDIAVMNVISGSLAIAFLVVMVCAIVGCRKHRAMVVRQQIKRLNRLWHLDSSTNLS